MEKCAKSDNLTAWWLCCNFLPLDGCSGSTYIFLCVYQLQHSVCGTYVHIWFLAFVCGLFSQLTHLCVIYIIQMLCYYEFIYRNLISYFGTYLFCLESMSNHIIILLTCVVLTNIYPITIIKEIFLHITVIYKLHNEFIIYCSQPDLAVSSITITFFYVVQPLYYKITCVLLLSPSLHQFMTTRRK